MNPMPNTAKSIVRALMPWLISIVASAIAHFGFHVSAGTTIKILAGAGAVLTVALHMLEAKFPWVGVFLGYLGAPVYAPSVKKVQASQIAELQAEVDSLRAKAYESSTPSPVTDGGSAVPSTFTPAPPTSH